MSKDLNHIESELDAKLKEKYANYSVQPDEALWNNVNSRVAEKKLLLSQTKIKWLRAASIVFALGFLGLLANQVVQYYGYQRNEIGDKTLSSPQYPSQSPTDSGGSPVETDSAVTEIFDQSASKLKVDSVRMTPNFQETDNTKAENDAGVNTSEMEPLASAEVEEQQEEQGNLEGGNRHGPVSSAPARPEAVGHLPAIFDRASVRSEESMTGGGPITVLESVEGSQEIQIAGSEVPVEQLKTMEGKWFAEGFASPSVSYRTVAANPEFVKVALYDKSYFNSREKAQLNWAYGLNGGYRLSEKIKVKTGLNLSSYSIKFKTGGKFFEKKSASEYTLYTSFGEALISLTGVDDVPVETVIKSNIALHYVSVPLAIEYQLLKHTAISFGVNFESLRSQELNWESNDQNVDSDERVTQISGVNKRSISLSFGVVHEQTLFNNTSVLVNPIFLSHIKSPSSSGPYHAYPNSLGIRIGVRRYF
ncbi:hypothetical protein RT717_01150 [Imperialibacter roseus]|uniref:Outer membrane protein beta-barrel domain-containing protein n=1 Tax=Imperialibacter roseus TaxID=1324217 RepID=A0ABZ0IRV5_9BACT|nr:hypothetical protein [Imperialibacter roseus]WOK07227.1 hypothetical protein RT717_01150 [Imperialibacter roseus]